MTSIERTAFPRFTRAPSVKELHEIYTPTPTDLAFVATTARGPAQKFALIILLTVYQRLGYFPKPETIPGAIISHIRAVMQLPADLVPDIASNHTHYRYYAAIREHLEIQSEEKHIRHIKRFGNYELDLSAIAVPVTDDLTFEIEPPQEAGTIEADHNTPVLATWVIRSEKGIKYWEKTSIVSRKVNKQLSISSCLNLFTNAAFLIGASIKVKLKAN